MCGVLIAWQKGWVWGDVVWCFSLDTLKTSLLLPVSPLLACSAAMPFWCHLQSKPRILRVMSHAVDSWSQQLDSLAETHKQLAFVLYDIRNMQEKNPHANMLLGMVMTRQECFRLLFGPNVLLAAVFHALWETEKMPKTETAITLISQKPTQPVSIHLFWWIRGFLVLFCFFSLSNTVSVFWFNT